MDATVHTPLGRKGTNNIDRFQMFKTKNVTQISQIPQILLQLGAIKYNSDNLDNIIHEY